MYRRHDISDRIWQILEPHLMGRKGTRGGNAQNNRRFINAIF
jgi:transposase